MKQTKIIRYKSIIDHGNNQKMTETYEGEASYEFEFHRESYTFRHENYGKMQILIKGNQVRLSHGNTTMEMTLNERQHILYQTLYGQIELEVYLKKLERTNHSIHLVYYLYDHSTILSKCYVMIDEINPMLS